MDIQQEVVKWLIDREKQSFPNTTPHHIQTHISHVIIGQSHSYKIKKNIKLDFLDFSTLEKRKFYCEEEIRINALRAPKVYISTVPIYTSGSNFSFENKSNGLPVEYAVKMNTFLQKNILSNLIDDSKRFLKLLDQCSTTILNSHKTAKPIIDDRYGGALNFRNMANAIIAQSKELNFIPKNRIDAYEKDLNSKLDLLSPTIDLRKINGHIKECHGDLHLNNICLVEGKIQLFDGIEFNQLYKNIDTLYDLAFLLMDLDVHNKEAESNKILNTYLELNGDYQSVELLPLYKSVRAYIRFMVIGLASKNVSLEESARTKLEKQSLQYLEYSEAMTHTRKGQVIIMNGFSGSGKSTVGKSISNQLNGIHIRSDALRKHLTDTNLLETKPELYTKSTTEQTYSKLNSLGVLLAKSGLNVVLDATYLDISYRNAIKDACLKNNLSLHIVHCHADIETLEKWIRERKNDISDATIEVLHQQVAQHSPISEEEKKYTINVSTSQRIDTNTITQRILRGDKE